MRRLIVCLILGWAPLSFGWNSSDHQAMAQLSLREVAEGWGLDRPVPVRPLESLLKKLPEELGDPWHFSDWLGINTAIDLEKPVPELAGRTSVTPLEILSFYSIDPDDGRDQDLFDRDEAGRPRPRYPDQAWFGALEGPNSQAFRHIEKPPFSRRDPIMTFGFPFRTIGEATRRFKIWFLASELAFAHGEEYWGWRFLANALHYLQDLHQPFHAGQITPAMLLQGFRAWPFGWGRAKGFVGTFAQLMSNTHRFFECFVDHPSERDKSQKERALFALRGKEMFPLPDDPQQLAIAARDESNRYFPPLLEMVVRLAKPELLGDHEFRSDPPEADDPQAFVRDRSSEVRRELFTLVNDRFAAASKSIRTAVRMALDRREQRDPAAIMQELTRTISGHSPR